MSFSSHHWRQYAVHPHVRGVYSMSSGTEIVIRGSSPRAWGLFRAFDKPQKIIRFIPTCVGFMQSTQRPSISSTVHPHVRGVYAGTHHEACPQHGSSPRAWGLSRPQSGATLLRSVHPHVRGVYTRRHGLLAGAHGSSPRAWGLCTRGTPPIRFARFIPTCVGFMPPRCIGRRYTAVHPHVRGVYITFQPGDRVKIGSSPRAWGLWIWMLPNALLGGSSPRAWGLCQCNYPPPEGQSVHPHVRGVYSV